MKILLIGGAGYVGSAITSTLLKNGHEISVLDNFVYDNQPAIQPFIGDPSYQIIKGDMGNYTDLNKVYNNQDAVVILAGLVGDPITKKFPEQSKSVNEVAIKNCIDYFDDKSINNLIFISTCSNYGLIQEDDLADEEFPLSPLSLYAKAKVAAEKYILEKKGKVNYSATILRFATAFGLSPRMRFDLSVSEFTKELFSGNELLVFDEHTWRPYCHIRDFGRLIEKVLAADKNIIDFEVFNAGGEVNNHTKKMIVDLILKHMKEGKVSYTANGSDPRNYKVSFKKVKEKLDFEPQFTVEDGIKELIDALSIGLYSDRDTNKTKYGNYNLNI